ncbi:MAG: PhoX family phosphatase, partial [Cyanobacteria bacterium P01_E01_bin.6]
PGGVVNFEAIPISEGSGPDANISPDYNFEVLIPWGASLQPTGTSYEGDPNSRPTADQQAQQIGIGHDGMHFFPIDGSNEHGVIAINHEFGTNFHLVGIGDGGNAEQVQTLEQTRLSQNGHGVSVIEVRKINGTWQNVASDKNRRITVNTPVTFSGPAAGHPLLQTPIGNNPQGTVNNCSNGKTPWGTYLTCEENFNGYFGATGEWTPTASQERYGFSETGFNYGWYNHDPRFDLSNTSYRNEENRFGWVVEIDPMNPSQTPVKRTALGRMKHENAELVVNPRNRVVVYMGDDQRFDYIYRFVSAGNYQQMIRQGRSPLDEGILYVGQFRPSGRVYWLPLTMDNPVLRENFANQAEILINTRIAADLVGATPMDRPEWVSVAPNDRGDVFISLTNNSQRTQSDRANPLAPNPDGHILWIRGKNHIKAVNRWDVLIRSVETHGEGDERNFSDPDGIMIDSDGRLFIQTDGGQQQELNNQMLVADLSNLRPNARENRINRDQMDIRRMFTGPAGCEVTGITTTPDRRTMFINVQHPGDGDPSLTSFPAPFGSGRIPRDSTIVITKKDGGIIGS